MSSKYGRMSSAVAGLPYAIRITASLTARPVPFGHAPGTVPVPARNERSSEAARPEPSFSATARGLSPGHGRFGQGSRGHRRRFVDELHQASEQLRVGLGQHAVAEVEDVARPT